MKYTNIDLIIDKSFKKVSASIPTITQYATNYKLRIAFTDPKFRPSLIKLSINNGKTLPGRSVFLSSNKFIIENNSIVLTDELDSSVGYLYEYPLVQYDTEIFSENLSFTISGYDKDDNLIGVIVERIPMQKSTFSNFSSVYIDDDSSLNRVIEKVNESQEEINGILGSLGPSANIESYVRSEIEKNNNNFYTKSDLYTKLEVDDKITVNNTHYYTKELLYNKSEIDTLLSELEVDTSGIEDLINSKITENNLNFYTKSDVYTKTETDERIVINNSNFYTKDLVYTKTEVDDTFLFFQKLIAAKQGTIVSVNGSPVAEFDADTKLDKTVYDAAFSTLSSLETSVENIISGVTPVSVLKADGSMGQIIETSEKSLQYDDKDSSTPMFILPRKEVLWLPEEGSEYARNPGSVTTLSKVKEGDKIEITVGFDSYVDTAMTYTLTMKSSGAYVSQCHLYPVTNWQYVSYSAQISLSGYTTEGYTGIGVGGASTFLYNYNGTAITESTSIYLYSIYRIHE